VTAILRTVLLGVAADDSSWQDWAACRRYDEPDDFFPVGDHDDEDAKRVCRGCTVTADCLAYALDHGIEFGVWGGMSEEERRALRLRAV
jgi:WhiB family redox-sensing transcriptional regulator